MNRPVRFLALVLGVVVFSQSASRAAILSATLADLDGGDTLCIGGTVFDQWSVVDNPNALDLSKITVTLSGDELNPSLSYVVNDDLLRVESSVVDDFVFNVLGFEYRILGGANRVVEGTMDGFESEVGNFDAVALISSTLDGAAPPTSEVLDVFHAVDDSGVDVQPSDTAAIDPNSQVLVDNFILISASQNALATGPASAEVLAFRQSFRLEPASTAIPEPTTILMWSLLAVVGLVARRRLHTRV